jgi:hypothetical protein
MVGRYRILEVLGSGAMGTVYAAFDPELDRRIAVKVIPLAQGARMSEEAKLRDEARTLAKLNHPSVVTVHDAGVADGQLFIAMELAKGTLRDWLLAERRQERDIIRTFCKAGEGLAAAHREGIVHRDFKPQNVLIDAAGQPRVSDFGLAHVVGVGDGGGGRARVGTPAYMAPEQLRGDPVDERADQFAFSVALKEALVGEGGRSSKGAKGLHGRWRLARVLERGMSARLEQRYPSMDALLGALRRATDRRRVWVPSIVALVLVAAVGIWAERRHLVSTCRSAPPPMAEAWNAARRASVRSAFSKTGLLDAKQSLGRVENLLASYVQDASSLAVESCLAARVQRFLPGAEWELRKQCLHRLSQDLGALAQVLEDADRSVVQGSIRAAMALEAVATCRRPSTAWASTDVDSVSRSAQADVLATLARGTALQRAYQPARALVVAEQVVTRARSLGHPLFLTQGLVLKGSLEAQLSHASAKGTLQEAVWLAQANRLDEWAFRASLELAKALSYEHPSEAELWTHYAESMWRRGPSEAPDAELELQQARLSSAREDSAGAQKHLEAALQLIRGARGEGSAQELEVLRQMAVVSHHVGNADEVTRVLERALALSQRTFGPEHVETAQALMDLALAYRAAPAKQVALLKRALPVLSDAFGEGEQVAVAEDRLSQALASLGDVSQALDASLNAVRILKGLGPDRAAYAFALGNLSGLRLRSHEPALAQAAAREDAEVLLKLFGTDNYRLATPYELLSASFVALQRPREAQRWGARALSAWEHGPKSRFDIPARAHFDLAQAARALGTDHKKIEELADAAMAEAKRAGDSVLAEEIERWLDRPAAAQ